ncbi:MAG TPA: HAMP domain-containing sensor histidine kinase [Thermoanaerobaculia bacterium]|nr:HAMP domain-containing sensor histidine kinase [Thermoanaerobaculia bacterium]
MREMDRTFLLTSEDWTRFVSAFVHELRTPLASFRMLTDLLLEAPDGQLRGQERRYSENLREVAQDLQGLVGDVSELTRLLAGRVQVRPEEVILDQLFDQVEEAVRPRSWERGIALTESRDPALPRLFRTDPDHLRQALTLLLETAVSHAESEVFLRFDLGDGDLRVALSSDGPPFPEAVLPALFAPFHQDIRATRQRGGRSLALPLAYELSRALGGSLRAENRGGRPGFTLAIPQA